MKYLNIGFYLLLVFLVFFPFLVFPRIIVINKIECFSQYGICDDELFNKVNIGLSNNLIKSKEKITELFKEDRTIKDYSFQYKLPRTLRIDLIIEKAKFALKDKYANKYWLVGKDGKVIETGEKTALPFVVIDNNFPQTGDKISEERLFALNLLYDLYYLYQLKSGEIVSDSLEVILPNGPKVFFPLDTYDKDYLLGSLKIILSRLNQEDIQSKITIAKEIDLRYKNPIIR